MDRFETPNECQDTCNESIALIVAKLPE